MIKRKKDAKEKNVGKTIIIIFFHYFEQNDQYRIERSPVIIGNLKNVKKTFQFANTFKKHIAYLFELELV